MRIKKPRKYVYIELRLFTINENAGPNTMNWDAGTTLQLEDSIMSSNLYQDNCVVMAKVIKEKVSCDLLFSCHFTRFVCFPLRFILRILLKLCKYF
jgi:hypothetical protein